MDSATRSKKALRLRGWLDAARPQRIGEAEWNALLEHLAPVSESRLRQLVRRTGVPFEQPWAGVRQSSFEELEQSLLSKQEARSKKQEVRSKK